MIIEGRGWVELGDPAPQAVGPGDIELISAGCRPRIANAVTGDLVFLAMFTQRFTPAAYEDLRPG